MPKKILKDIILPIVFKVFRTKKTNKLKTETWSGTFTSWQEAKAHSIGYDSETVYKNVKIRC